MKTTRQTLREAKRLFHLCMVDGTLDEQRIRQVVQSVIDSGRPGSLKVLTRFHRLVRIARDARSATIESPSPLPGEVRAQIESDLARLYGQGLVTSYADDPTLLGGVRIRVGSDVFDGSIKARLEDLEERF
jgi:F-type H+-transporting ATPase subunit delta